MTDLQLKQVTSIQLKSRDIAVYASSMIADEKCGYCAETIIVDEHNHLHMQTICICYPSAYVTHLHYMICRALPLAINLIHLTRTSPELRPISIAASTTSKDASLQLTPGHQSGPGNHENPGEKAPRSMAGMGAMVLCLPGIPGPLWVPGSQLFKTCD